MRSKATQPSGTISAPEDSLRGRPTKASESGHLKRSFSSPQVASAQTTSGSAHAHPDAKTRAGEATGLAQRRFQSG